jgi:hypothetical protein
MAHDPQPHLDGKRHLHAVVGLILLLIVVVFLGLFIVTNWRRNSQMDGGGLLGSDVITTRIVATA